MGKRLVLVAGAACIGAGLMIAGAVPSEASTGSKASCLGQYFSSHAGLGAAHIGETVGSMTSGAAQELRGLGPLFAATRFFPRSDCGL